MTRPTPIDADALLGHAAWMRALAASLLADASAADDVVQETWLAAARHAPASGRLEPWLARVVRNFAWKRRRSERRRADHERLARAREPVASPSETVERLESSRALVDAVLALDEPFRTTLYLHYYEERTSAEIASAQGVAAGTVRWRLHRGVELLRARLDASYGSRATWGALLVPLARPAESTVVGTGTGAAAAALPGAMAMSVGLKLCVGGVVGVALAGVAWWGSQAAERAPLEDVASVAPADEPVLAAAPAELASDAPVREVASRAEPAVVPPAPAPSEPPAEESVPAPAAPRVQVRFVDERGAPLEGVVLAADVEGGAATIPSPLGEPVRSIERTSSGPDGRAELANESWGRLPVTRVEMRASREGTAAAVLTAVVRPGEITHLGDVVLAAGVRLRGRVLDPSGRGIADAAVGIAPADLDGELGDAEREGRAHRHGIEAFGAHATTQSDASGGFVLDGVAPGAWRLWGWIEGSRYAWSEPFDTVAGVEPDALELVLEPLRAEDRIEGIVVGPDGAPIGQAELALAYQGTNEGGTTGLEADAEGRFRVLVYVGGTYRLIASDPFHRYAEASSGELRPGDADVVITLQEKRTLEVRAKSASGEAIGSVSVWITATDEQWVRSAPEPEDGEPVRLALPAFPFYLHARAAGHRDARIGPLNPELCGSHVDVTLEAAPLVRGSVLADGAPVAGARVQIVRASEEGRTVKDGFPLRMDVEPLVQGETSAGGAFELALDVDAAEAVYVRVLASGWATAELGPLPVARATAEPAQIELPRGGTIEGRVLRPDGGDGAGVVVGVSCGDGDARTVRAGPGGAYRFEGLRPGKWQVLSRDTELVPFSRTVMTSDHGTPIEWSCEVFDGRATTYDLTVR